eukprot:4071704-Prymnesium_polylepis.1
MHGHTHTLHTSPPRSLHSPLNGILRRSEYKPLGHGPLPKAAALGTAMLSAQQIIKLVEHEVKGEAEHAHRSSFPSQLRRAGCMHANTSLKITKWTENQADMGWPRAHTHLEEMSSYPDL